MKSICLFIFISFLWPATTSLWGKQPLLRHYTVRDGLPSNVIYDVFQDSKGYIWFSTDQGVSRFDGTRFVNFTPQDGLPDNEIFWVKEDEWHRYWLMCFNNRVCYMYKDKVYNSRNDTLCRRLEQVKMQYYDLTKSENGKWILSGRHIAVLDSNNFHLRLYNEFTNGSLQYFFHNGLEYVNKDEGLIKLDSARKGIAAWSTYQRTIQDGADMFGFKIVKDRQTLEWWKFTPAGLRKTDSIPVTAKVHNMSKNPDGNILCCTERGMLIYNKNTRTMQKDTTLPDGIFPNCALTDSEGNRWFTTINDGAYLMLKSSPYIINTSSGLSNNNVLSLNLTSDGTVIAGGDNGTINLIGKNHIRHFSIIEEGQPNRILFAQMMNKRTLIAICDLGLYKIGLKTGGITFIHKGAFKACRMRHNYCLTGDSYGPGIYNTNDGSFKYFFCHRTTAVEEDAEGTVWAGTLNGLYYYSKGNKYPYTKDPLLERNTITSIAITHDGAIITGTNTSGIFIITDRNSPPLHIDRKDGLSGNNCKKVLPDQEGNIWVCSEGGLDRLTRQAGESAYRIQAYTLPDGLSGFRINDIALWGSQLYLATAEGIVVLNKYENTDKVPRLYIQSVNGIAVNPDGANRKLSYAYDKNDLEVAYTGISFTGGQNLRYKYFLKGGNGDTVFTQASIINFSALKPGKYEFLLWAKNKTGSWTAKPESLYLNIEPPPWLDPHYMAPTGILMLLSTIFLYRKNIKKVKINSGKEAGIRRQLAELEVKALRAQINPHFIFNALNSIQTYYRHHDDLKANYYMTSFAQFIRKTLTNSQSHWLSLTEELKMLQTYIDLEHMRFKELFSYTIDVAADISPGETEVPTMLIQPYVENAINHGFRYMKDRKGILSLRFTVHDNILCCAIEDNGIGINHAQNERPEHHKSLGMHINRQRIESMNQLYNIIIELKVMDKQDLPEGTNGTIIEVYIPLKNRI